MKVCIYGVGAIGGLIAARLAHSGVDVSAVARGATLAAIQANGIRVFEPASSNGDEPVWQESTAPIKVSDNPVELGRQDLVIVAVKANALPLISEQIAPLLGPKTVIVSAMNGVPWWFLHGLSGAPDGLNIHAVDPQGQVAAAMAAERTIGCVVHVAASTRAPGVAQRNFGNKLILGEPNGLASERLADTVSILDKAGFEIEVSENIHQSIWYKLWGNMTMNPVSAITGAQTHAVLSDPLLSQFMIRAMTEAGEVGERLGLPVQQSPLERNRLVAGLGSFKTSMLQDAQSGRPLELGALIGVVHELGQQLDVATPNIDALLGLSRVFAQQHGLV